MSGFAAPFLSFSSSFFSFFLIFIGKFLRFVGIMKDAVKKGDAKEVAELIRQDPGFKVNMDHTGQGHTLLPYACDGDSKSAVIPLLLAHPDIDVNLKSKGGSAPFSLACVYGYTSCVREMLKDSRVKVNEPDDKGSTPLWYAAYLGCLDVIKWWIASGREMDLGNRGDAVTADAIAAAKKKRKTEVVTLLERFKSDAAKTRSEVRKELGIHGQCTPPFFLFPFNIILDS